MRNHLIFNDEEKQILDLLNDCETSKQIEILNASMAEEDEETNRQTMQALILKLEKSISNS